jgi:hypothetical protein
MAIVPAKVVSLTLTEEHSGTGHGPGIHAAVVMPRYIDSVANLTQTSELVLAQQGVRLEKAVEFIHTLGLVHMDIKVTVGVMVSQHQAATFALEMVLFATIRYAHGCCSCCMTMLLFVSFFSTSDVPIL